MQLLCLFPVSLIVCLPHPGCLLLFRTLELYFCGSSGSPASLFLPLISLSCHLPSLPVRFCVPRVSALCISDGWPFLVWRLLSLLPVYSPPPPLRKKLQFWLCFLCLFCVIAPVIIHNWPSFFFQHLHILSLQWSILWSQSKLIHFRSVWLIFFVP